MLCPYCNATLEDGATECPACGAAALNTLADEQPDLLDELTPDEALPIEEETSPKRKKVYRPVWALLAIILAGLITLLIFLLANGHPHERNPFNLFENGLVPVCTPVDGEERRG